MQHPGRHFSFVGRRIASVLCRLAHACNGVETVEFALVSIPLFAFMLGSVEFARAYWTQSELQYAAEAAARCETLVQLSSPSPASCDGTSVDDNYDLQRFAAQKLLGMSVPSGNLSNFQVNAASCGNQVSFTYSFGLLTTNLLPIGPITLSATACHQA
jgi:hypothetical protein